MRLQSPWKPYLADIDANAAERLERALADDIINGRLKGGDRLPAHRDLAWRLSIGLGTVTKAYAALDRRGLTRSVKGRGTFVAILKAHRQQQIDLSSNVPPGLLSERTLSRTLVRIAKKIDPSHLSLYAPPAGHFEHRRLMAHWLQTQGVATQAQNLILTGNARQAIALAFELTCRPNGVIFAEHLTYPGAIALARRSGLQMRGVAVDAEGMIPDALKAAIETEKAGRKVVYLTPTLHNPTTATMSASRRRAIVEICQSTDTLIIEDGVYGFARPDLQPLAVMAPDMTLHVNSLSKSVGPGLRVGMLVVPVRMKTLAEGLVQDLPMEPAALSCAVVEDWLANGYIEKIQKDLLEEAGRRSQLAASLLGAEGIITHPAAYHAWLPTSEEVAGNLFTAAASMGIKVTPVKSVLVDEAEEARGIRFCLGGASLDALTEAFTAFSKLLRRDPNFMVGNSNKP